MDIKQSVWVYIETEDGKVAQISQELLGKGRELADAKGKKLVALVLSADLGLVADCIDCRYEGDGDDITWIRPAFTGKLYVKILTTTRPQLATVSAKIFRGNKLDLSRSGEVLHEKVDLQGQKALGVSKPLVDNGWATHDQQIGITGKKIAPKIYIALGISGAIQHKLGLAEAPMIIAVNKDPDAPIFEFAHYGIVGDLFEAIPALEKEFAKYKS